MKEVSVVIITRPTGESTCHVFESEMNADAFVLSEAEKVLNPDDIEPIGLMGDGWFGLVQRVMARYGYTIEFFINIPIQPEYITG